MKPHELAPHVAQLCLRVVPGLRPAEIALECALEVLRKARPMEFDPSDVDRLYVYCLQIDDGNYATHVKSAAGLARMCLLALERKCLIERDKIYIPMLLQAIVGLVPDKAVENASKKRPNRSKPDALGAGIKMALQANPDDDWLTLARWLMGEDDGAITRIDNQKIWFVDDGREKAVATSTFQNRVSKARKALQK